LGDELGVRLGGGKMDEKDPLTHAIIGAAIEVHRVLGPGLLESVYERCLSRELELRGIVNERQVLLPVVYKGIHLEEGYRIDILVERKVVVEVKAVDAIAPVHEAQLLTYLRLSNIHVGLLLNFHVALIKDGIKRMVL
jgi:GxxExxY protein